MEVGWLPRDTRKVYLLSSNDMSKGLEKLTGSGGFGNRHHEREAEYDRRGDLIPRWKEQLENSIENMDRLIR
jgi:hypothetical protein